MNQPCILQSCPPNASGAPNCLCNTGYDGTLSWNYGAMTWNGFCSGDSSNISGSGGNSSGISGSGGSAGPDGSSGLTCNQWMNTYDCYDFYLYPSGQCPGPCSACDCDNDMTNGYEISNTCVPTAKGAQYIPGCQLDCCTQSNCDSLCDDLGYWNY
jgi:hypothetical protein